MTEKIAIYPGTFDPVTLGHMDVITKAMRLFDRLVVAVAQSERKQTLFDFDQRVTMVSSALAHYGERISVVALAGLLVDSAKAHGADFIIKGLRSGADFDYEYQQVEMNQRLNSDINTVFVSSDSSVRFISSTMIREIIRVGGDISAFVPDVVSEALSWR